ncbi:hypothetical protein CU044_0072 [Streptomyces sp. L-9-10]|nr:hypothetical protein CU044_0072 [Streptomyces sp. L-9-10]
MVQWTGTRGGVGFLHGERNPLSAVLAHARLQATSFLRHVSVGKRFPGAPRAPGAPAARSGPGSGSRSGKGRSVRWWLHG